MYILISLKKSVICMKVFYEPFLLTGACPITRLAGAVAMVTTVHREQGSLGQGVALCWLAALESGPENTATLFPNSPLFTHTHCNGNTQCDTLNECVNIYILIRTLQYIDTLTIIL